MARCEHRVARSLGQALDRSGVAVSVISVWVVWLGSVARGSPRLGSIPGLGRIGAVLPRPSTCQL
eukprot:4021567-Alexandrium_andersonii.AAC.1